MSLRNRRGGLIPRAWASVRARVPPQRPVAPPAVAPPPAAQPANTAAAPTPGQASLDRPGELEDRLELARRRLKQSVPPRQESQEP